VRPLPLKRLTSFSFIFKMPEPIPMISGKLQRHFILHTSVDFMFIEFIIQSGATPTTERARNRDLVLVDFGPGRLKGDAAIARHSGSITAETTASISTRFLKVPVVRTGGEVCYLRCLRNKKAVILLWNLGRPSKNPAYRIIPTEYSGCLDISAHA